ncbi:phosphoglycerate dehydrogenase [Leptolyngbya sp. 15MV]|nr:phosphoglycerate dehydrogenase [Leptolyngbya sp. 15MV]
MTNATKKPRVLISDKMDPNAARIFEERGCEVDVITGETPEQLIARIGDYDGLAIRSSTKVTKAVIEAADNLKVVGRAGIGVDNVDIPAASAKGVVVMNTPFGNSITTAEHAIALIMALARQLPAADTQTQAGTWPKNAFMGVEVTGKTLGLIGAGNIGSIVASRALGLRMKVIAFDPFLTEDRAIELGIEKVDLDTLLARADFITLHTPLTDQTRNILSRENLEKTKQGVRIVNCARGGLIDEAALKDLLDNGHVAGAALDVFAQEPPPADHPLFGTPNFICTPHLGASTTEAQVNVALQVAEQMADYLVSGGVTNALNMPSLSAEEAPKLKPYMALAERLGSLVGQLAHGNLTQISIEREGAAASLSGKPIEGAVLAGLMKQYSDAVNMVNAPFLAKERGLDVRSVRHEREGVPAWVSYRPMVELCGGRIVEIPATLESGFKITPQQLRSAITPRSRLLMMNTPSNPCGTMYSEADLRALGAVVAEAARTIAPQLVVVVDEIYEKICYGGVRHFSMGAIPEIAQRTVTVNGMSKAFAMTGWRVGYCAAPGAFGAQLIRAIDALQGQQTSCITSFVYPAVREAIARGGAFSAQFCERFAARGRLMHELASAIPGLRLVKPTGAFYLFPDVSAYFGCTTPGGRTITSALAFAEALLDEGHVTVVPGEEFGGCGKNHIRLSFACNEDKIRTGMHRVADFCASLKPGPSTR